ncbi:MAG: RHS repeat-associated core domain-containing protein, partial [Kiritimatiellales bacterium]
YPNGVNSSFGYDAESRVTNYTHGSFISRSIIRGPRGFKTHENIAAGLSPSISEGEQKMVHNDADQLTKITQRDSWLGGELNQWYDRNYTYDNNGCLTQENVSRPSWNTNSAIDEYRNDYTWDYDNRLTGAEKTVLIGSNVTVIAGITDRTWTDGPSVSTEYLYDASGVRIGRVHNSVTNYFVVDYADPLKRPFCETDSSGTVTRYYVWAGFRLLAHIEADGTVRYYHSDELGSTLALTDESGNVTDEFSYSPYGKQVSRTGTTQTPFQWLGGYGVYYDSSVNLHLTLHRAYSADMRRWLSTDPMGIDGGVNLYAYGALNPLAFVDPYGLCAGSFNWKTSAAGAAQMFGGGVEATAGYTFGAVTAVSGIGAVAGAVVGTHGLDNAQAGFRQMVTGQPVDTMTSLSIQGFGVNRNTANMANAGLSIAFTAGVGYLNSSAVNTVPNMATSSLDDMSRYFTQTKATQVQQNWPQSQSAAQQITENLATKYLDDVLKPANPGEVFVPPTTALPSARWPRALEKILDAF